MQYISNFKHRLLVSLRYRMSFLFKFKKLPRLEYINDDYACNKDILNAIKSGKPFMVSRFGIIELCVVVNGIWVSNNKHSYLGYITGRQEQWWWDRLFVEAIQTLAGFFPLQEEHLMRFSKLIIEDAKCIDILGTDMGSNLIEYEVYLNNEIRNARRYFLGNLKPLYKDQYSKFNWLQGLKGKRVLVIHPFAETITNQYNSSRTKLFPNPDFLPEFTLLTLKAVQSLGGECEFNSWFEALDYMKEQMDKIDYDVCILGCGAYGLPLAAHAKRTGHQAIHLGGGTQILFGIKGKRWDDSDYFKPFFNEYWTRPNENETPKTAKQVEGGCYW